MITRLNPTVHSIHVTFFFKKNENFIATTQTLSRRNINSKVHTILTHFPVDPTPLVPSLPSPTGHR